MYIYLNFLYHFTEKILLISSILLSTFSAPVNIPVYKIGSTIKNEINIDKFLELNHTNASIINDTTGVAFITDINGFNNSFIILFLYEQYAKNIDIINPMAKPEIILEKENKIVFQKSAVTISSINFFITKTGDTINISCPIISLIICHTNIQKIKGKVLFIKNFFTW